MNFIKDKIIINVTDDKITDLLDDFLKYKPSDKFINGQKDPSSLIEISENEGRSIIATQVPVELLQVGYEKVNNDLIQSKAREKSNMNPMNVGDLATMKKCHISKDDRNYNNYQRLLLDIEDRNNRIEENEKEKIKLNKRLNKLMKGETYKTREKSNEYKRKSLELSIKYCDTYIDDYKKDITRLTKEINELCDEEEDELY